MAPTMGVLCGYTTIKNAKKATQKVPIIVYKMQNGPQAYRRAVRFSHYCQFFFALKEEQSVHWLIVGFDSWVVTLILSRVQ